MSLSYLDVLKKIEELMENPNSIKISDLEDLINQVSLVDNTAPKGAITHLYTKMGNDTSFINDNIRILDHTDGAKVLNSQGYNDAISQAFRNEYPKVNADKLTNLIGDYKFGPNTNGTTGPWAEISKRFVSETTGDVICHIGDIEGAKTRT